jgi:hypothetical protein
MNYNLLYLLFFKTLPMLSFVRKNFLLLFISFCFVNAVSAKDRTVSEAIQLVSQFMHPTVEGLQKAPAAINSTLSLSYTSLSKEAATSGKVLYYVFNKGNNNGYVIISGDDRAKTILGYTDEGDFDITELPVNVKGWLDFYDDEIKSLSESIPQSDESITSTISKVTAVTDDNLKPIAPLLGNIKWNQNYPYNNQCPVINTSTGERAATGCVATGMAQVMKYYKWPVQGTGTSTYTISSLGVTKSVDLANAPYDWGNMTDTYSTSSANAQINAIATLMYQCGVAVNMDYGRSSSASTSNMASALINNFGYDSNLQLYNRDYCTRSEWISLLNTELNLSRPVLYSGNSDYGGHLFVCDGYNSNGLYHFNWGWGGNANGYYEISALDTDNPGTILSTVGFNINQSIVVGLQKPNANSTPTFLMNTTQPLTCSTSSVTRTGSFTITGNGIFNFGVNTFSGDVGLGLFDDTGLVQVIQSKPVTDLGSNYGWSEYPVQASIPAGTSNGIYKLYFIYKATSETEWKIIKGKVGTANFIHVVISNSAVTIHDPSSSEASLELDSLKVTGNLYQNKTGRFSVTVTNNGNEYNSILGINLTSATNGSVSQLVNTELVNIASGETRTMEFDGKITVDPGKYNITAVYDSLNDNSTANTLSQFGDSIPVNVLKAPTEEPVLTLTRMISFPNSTSVEKNDVSLSAKIKNNAGYFENKLIAYVFSPAGGNAIANFGYQNAILDTNEEETITFSGSLDLSPANYQIGIYYLNSSGTWKIISPSTFSLIPFTIVEDITAVNNQFSTQHLEIYPNPVPDILQVITDQPIRRIFITDLFGKQLKTFDSEMSDHVSIDVNDLPSGTYLIKVQTQNEIENGKFFKK